MFGKLKLRVQGTHLHSDAGEFDEHVGTFWGIWCQRLARSLLVTMASLVTGPVQQNW